MTVEIGLFTLAGFYLLFVAPVGLNVITVEFCLTLFRVGVRSVHRGIPFSSSNERFMDLFCSRYCSPFFLKCSFVLWS